jgi:hypothetical protein
MKMLLGERDHPAIDEKLFRACYLDWRDQQLSRPIKDPFRFAYEGTERELGRRQGWPANHAATAGCFAGLLADFITRWSSIGTDVLPGHWVGSLPALVVGVIVYVVLVILDRTWGQRLDYHLAMAIECNETKRPSQEDEGRCRAGL